MSDKYTIWIKVNHGKRFRQFLHCIFERLFKDGYNYNDTILGRIEGLDSFKKRHQPGRRLLIDATQKPPARIQTVINILFREHGGFLTLGKTWGNMHYPISLGIQESLGASEVSIGIEKSAVADLGNEQELTTTFQGLCNHLTKSGFNSRIMEEKELLQGK